MTTIQRLIITWK